jgi:malate dehydrogenase (oxaloacetate-decarboxylating)
MVIQKKFKNKDKNGRKIAKDAMKLHKKLGGKIETVAKIEIENNYDLSLVYTPGVAEICKKIKQKKETARELTIKKDTIAIVSDGSAVLGLGNLGPESALPVMEGKSMLFKKFANINAVPLCIDTQDKKEIVNFVKNISPTFGGINLEDISAPRCFEIENELQNLGIPVFHDDQHGTAIVVLAALINSLKIVDKNFGDIKIVINGAGAAGTAIANLLNCIDCYSSKCKKFKEIIICDSKGIITKNRKDIKNNFFKQNLVNTTNKNNVQGNLSDALKNADVFIGVSKGEILTGEMIKLMNSKPIIFAMANPVPEIFPEEAYENGAFIIGTGRSDYPNQINNLLVFPGIFRGALNAKAKKITNYMKISAAFAIADSVKDLNKENILPSPFSPLVHKNVIKAVKRAALNPINRNLK